MSSEQFTADQLKSEIERMKKEHKIELNQKDDTIRELKASLKVKRQVEDVIHAEYTQGGFSKFMISTLASLDKNKTYASIYLKWMSVFNFAIVLGIGVLLHTYAYNLGTQVMGPVFGNILAKFIAFFTIWNFSVGPLGYLFGLSPKKKVVKET